MAISDSVKDSIIEFEDKHIRRNSFSGEDEPDEEKIKCEIPELDFGEKIVLNAYGLWEAHHYNEHRRRLGIYLVTSKVGEGNPRYVLREETRFSEEEIVHGVFTGNFAKLAEITKGLKYIALDKSGRPLSNLVFFISRKSK